MYTEIARVYPLPKINDADYLTVPAGGFRVTDVKCKRLWSIWQPWTWRRRNEWQIMVSFERE